MIIKKSAREILKESEIKNKLKECFKKCALGRIQLRKCVVNSMDVGLLKEEVFAITDELVKEMGQDEVSFCVIVSVGEVLRYEEKHGKAKPVPIADVKKEEIKKKLGECFRKCTLARRQLRKCVVNAMDAGLTKEEVLLITDDIVGGVGKDEVSLCGIIAVDQVLRYEETSRKKPIDVVKERRLERGDA